MTNKNLNAYIIDTYPPWSQKSTEKRRRKKVELGKAREVETNDGEKQSGTVEERESWGTAKS
jgi:hypothetical protein